MYLLTYLFTRPCLHTRTATWNRINNSTKRKGFVEAHNRHINSLLISKYLYRYFDTSLLSTTTWPLQVDCVLLLQQSTAMEVVSLRSGFLGLFRSVGPQPVVISLRRSCGSPSSGRTIPRVRCITTSPQKKSRRAYEKNWPSPRDTIRYDTRALG